MFQRLYAALFLLLHAGGGLLVPDVDALLYHMGPRSHDERIPHVEALDDATCHAERCLTGQWPPPVGSTAAGEPALRVDPVGLAGEQQRAPDTLPTCDAIHLPSSRAPPSRTA